MEACMSANGGTASTMMSPAVFDALWGQETCLVWLPRRVSAVRVLQTRLVPLKASDAYLLHRLSYVSAGARIADALERDTLLAPLEGTVIPLPHQLLALQRATPTRVANTMTVNPIAAALLATQLVGEPITPNLVAGLVAVFAGIWIATSQAKKA